VTVQIIEKLVEIPEDVNLTLKGYKITVTGVNGKVERDFSHAKLNINYKDNMLRFWAENPRRKEAALVNTLASHVRNMSEGVTKGFQYSLKIVFIHFPMNIQIQGNKIIINNFIGEQRPRTAKILHGVEVRVEGDDIIVSGPDIEAVGQTAANIQQSTHIRNKDLRKFLDGIYVYKKE
jgi:large subunit ribosomal protein L6